MTKNIFEDLEEIAQIIMNQFQNSSIDKNEKQFLLDILRNFDTLFLEKINPIHIFSKKIQQLGANLKEKLFFFINNQDKNISVDFIRETTDIIDEMKSIISKNPELFIIKENGTS